MSNENTYEWDADKAEINKANHGVEFEAVKGFEWETALIAEDTRHDYGETRQIALGLIGPRVHVCVFTVRKAAYRIISLRKANRRETKMFTRMYIGD